MSVRDVADRLTREGYENASKSNVSRWLKGAKVEAPTKRGKTTATTTAAAPASKPRARTRPREDEADLPEELQGLDTESLDLADLTRIDKVLGKLLTKTLDEDEIKTWAALVKLKMDLRLAMAKLRPTPKVDPETDPLGIEAREAVLAKVKAAIEGAQRRLVVSPDAA